ncbi:hypothetical protein C8R44DRAFT_349346 [Mycena epipterygia]|nr:hypothetical protein C8R44DRAFT_349346 [Mycena epipterygia]
MSSSGPAHNMAVQIWDITTKYIGTQKSKNLHIKVFKQGETIKKQDYNASACKIILNPPYSIGDGVVLHIQLVQKNPLTRKSMVVAAMEFTVESAKEILSQHNASKLTDHAFHHALAGFCISFSMEETATTKILDAARGRAGELWSISDRLRTQAQFLKTVITFGVAASELHPIAKAVLAGVDQIYKLIEDQDKCDKDILGLLSELSGLLICITDIKQFVKSNQLKQALELVNPLVCDAANFLSKYSSIAVGTRFWALTFGVKTREELDNLLERLLSFKRRFDRGLGVESIMGIASMKMQLKSLLDITSELSYCFLWMNCDDLE